MFSILKKQLEFLCSLCFTWSEIAQLIGISGMTIYRCCEEFGMLEEPTATLTDSELKISEIRKILPEVGETSDVFPYLKTRCFCVLLHYLKLPLV